MSNTFGKSGHHQISLLHLDEPMSTSRGLQSARRFPVEDRLAHKAAPRGLKPTARIMLLMRPLRLRGWRRLVCAIALAVFGAGCQRPISKPLTMNDQIGFRAEAIKLLEEAAFGDRPAQRMQAIEAFKDVAPAEAMSRMVIPSNIESDSPAVSFAALMAAGEIGAKALIDRIRTRAESANPHVRMAALFALHRLGSTGRTGELSRLLLDHANARVRANAALVIGRLGGTGHAKLLKMALGREQKTAVKLQILESLALLQDRYATERLMLDGYSEYPDQATIALMMLVNAKCSAAEELFWTRLGKPTDFPEVRLQAARGLALLGYNDGLDLAIEYLFFRSPHRVTAHDPARQQIARVRGLAALALEAMAEPSALGALRKAFEASGQSVYVRIAIARAAVRTIDLNRVQTTEQDDESVAHARPAGQASE